MGRKVKARKAATPRKRTTARVAPNGRQPKAAAPDTAVHEAPVPRSRLVEDAVDAALDSLRRVLSDLVEQRLESVARELAEVRRELAGGAPPERLLEAVDELLERLGAVPFSAEPLDVIDPLIHAVVAERRADGVPTGVIVEAVRPGFRSARGHVLVKAAVAVSRG